MKMKEAESMAIKIEKLHFSYDSKNPVLNIDELNLRAGEKVFIYGPSGYGKSTLLNLISGVIPAFSGNIEVLGKKLLELSNSERDLLRGSEIGYIFQMFNLIPYLNVEENIQLSFKINPDRVRGLDVQKQVNDLIVALNLSEHRFKKTYHLSIGQQQRVAQARALVGQPSLIIADEPTSSLDANNSQEFMQLLINEWEKRKFTLVFVSHDERLKKYFDRSISLPEINKI